MTDPGGAFTLQTAQPGPLFVPAAVDRAAAFATRARDAGTAVPTAPPGRYF
jgi:hypothetical protein